MNENATVEMDMFQHARNDGQRVHTLQYTRASCLTLHSLLGITHPKHHDCGYIPIFLGASDAGFGSADLFPFDFLVRRETPDNVVRFYPARADRFAQTYTPLSSIGMVMATDVGMAEAAPFVVSGALAVGGSGGSGVPKTDVIPPQQRYLQEQWEKAEKEALYWRDKARSAQRQIVALQDACNNLLAQANGAAS